MAPVVDTTLKDSYNCSVLNEICFAKNYNLKQNERQIPRLYVNKIDWYVII